MVSTQPRVTVRVFVEVLSAVSSITSFSHMKASPMNDESTFPRSSTTMLVASGVIELVRERPSVKALVARSTKLLSEVVLLRRSYC
jgi:hypothetical protein